VSLLDIVRDAQSKELVSEDGDAIALTLAPGLSAEQMAQLEAKLPCPVPPQVRELLEACAGFDSGPLEVVDFTGASLDFETAPLLPNGAPIAADGFGNFWAADLSGDSADWAPIYFVCHDAPIFIYQSPSLEHFLTEMFKLATPPFTSLIDDVHEDRLFEVWSTNPGVKSHEECRSSGDDVLAAFASELGPTFQVIDLRNAAIGNGFSWGRYGPNTVVRRCGTEPIFAYEIRKGFLSRMFRSGSGR